MKEIAVLKSDNSREFEIGVNSILEAAGNTVSQTKYSIIPGEYKTYYVAIIETEVLDTNDEKEEDDLLIQLVNLAKKERGRL